MNHRTLPRFWEDFKRLSKDVQALADKNFELLKSDSHHPSRHFKKVNTRKQLWSARIGTQYHALGVEKPDGILWFWIGVHAEYEKMLK